MFITMWGNYRNKKGFTLVEIIVVLVILAILIAVIAPSLIGYIDKARNRTADMNARLVYTAATAALVDAYAFDATVTGSGKIFSDPNGTGRFYAYNPGTGWQAATNPGTLNPFTQKITEYIGDDLTGCISVWMYDYKIIKVRWQQNLPPNPSNENSINEGEPVGWYIP